MSAPPGPDLASGQDGPRTPRSLYLRRVHPAWVVAMGGFFCLLFAAGFRATPGVLIVPLQDEFGWSRATIAGAVSVNLVLFGFAGPFAAALTGKFGLRRVVPLAMGLVSLGSFATIFMTHAWQLYLCWGVLVGLGTGAVAPVLAATIANRWFRKRRGLVLGLLTAGSSTGQLLFLPFLAALSEDGHWRHAAFAVSVTSLVVVPVAIVLLRDRPSDLGHLAYGAVEGDAVVAVTTRPIRTAFAVLRRSAGKRAFWVLAGSFFICGASTNGLIATHFIPAAMDHNIPEVMAASMLAAMGVLDVVGTAASGWLTDRYDARFLLFMYYGLRGLSLLVLPHALAAQHLSLTAYVVFYGLDWIATVPPTVALCIKAFGSEQGIVVYGWVFAAHQLGAAMAAVGAGAIRDAMGDYKVAFLIAGTLCLIAAVAVLSMGKLADHDEPPQPPVVSPEAAEMLA